jgi:hypothetical protein
LTIFGQHYPPGTQENYNSFSSRNLMMGKGTELEFPEGAGRGQGGTPGSPYFWWFQKKLITFSLVDIVLNSTSKVILQKF